MANREWETVREALRKPASSKAMQEAAEAYARYQQTKKPKSRPTLVSLSLGKEYPTAIEVKDIPKELATNPKFFEHMKEIVEAEED